MAGTLNVTADVHTPDEDFTAVHIQVRNGTARLRRAGLLLEERTGVIAVERPTSRDALVRFGDGTEWTSHTPGGKQGCGCS